MVKVSAYICISLIVLGSSCNKVSNLLHENPDTTLSTIVTLEDAQAVLDNIPVFSQTPSLGELSSDDIFLADTLTLALNPVETRAYFWQSDIYQGIGQTENWNVPYQQVFFTNAVLEALPRIADSSNKEKFNFIKGSALFLRAYGLLQAASIFASLPNEVPGTLGIPLRLNTDPNIKSIRATVAETYDQIVQDLNRASLLLPAAVDSRRKNRPSKPAAFGLLARIYLLMGNYQKAGEYADSCLNYYSVLTDYNLLSTSTNPFVLNNPEVIYQTNLLSTTSVFESKLWFVDTFLYSSYDANDLRKDIFFKQNGPGIYPERRFNYSGTQDLFSGIAVDEIYLIRAEASAKLGDYQSAIDDLDTLLRKRWKTGTLPSLANTPNQDVLKLVRNERRKETAFRGFRWLDLRRYNRETMGDALKRITPQKEFILKANDPRFIALIPPDVIKESGMPQNPR